MSTEQLDFGFDPGAEPAGPVQRAKPRKVPSNPPAPAARGSPPAPPALAGASDGDTEALARELERHPDYRVLRRLVPRLHFDGAAQGPLLTVLVLDTETTGLDASKDRIIELALLRVQVDSLTGLPVGPVLVYDGLQDPGMPISKEVQEITGITDAMVRGQQLDEARITQMLGSVDLVLAHNAGFDRPFCESRLPQFAELRWGCSIADMNWKAAGFGSAKLEQLALHMGWFYDAHRAEVDCHALLAVLGASLNKNGGNALRTIVAASAQASYRLQATGAPFDAKDVLKQRGYRWNAEQKVWYTMLPDADALPAEFDWLKTKVYRGRAAKVQVEKLDAWVKYSARSGEISLQSI